MPDWCGVLAVSSRSTPRWKGFLSYVLGVLDLTSSRFLPCWPVASRYWCPQLGWLARHDGFLARRSIWLRRLQLQSLESWDRTSDRLLVVCSEDGYHCFVIFRDCTSLDSASSPLSRLNMHAVCTCLPCQSQLGSSSHLGSWGCRDFDFWTDYGWRWYLHNFVMASSEAR